MLCDVSFKGGWDRAKEDKKGKRDATEIIDGGTERHGLEREGGKNGRGRNSRNE